MAIKDLLSLIFAPWSGSPSRLDDIERRLKIIDGREPSSKDSPLGGELKKLHDKVDGREDKPKIEWKPSIFNAAVSIFILMWFAGFIVFSKDEKDGAFLEYFSYSVPLAAGFIAGIGFYRREWETLAFVISVGCLAASLVAFLRWKIQLFNVALDLIGFLAILLAMCGVWFANHRKATGKKRGSWEVLLAYFMFVIALGGSLTWTLLLANQAPDWLQGLMSRAATYFSMTSTNATATVIDKNAIATPAGVLNFCHFDDFSGTGYLRKNCPLEHKSNTVRWVLVNQRPEEVVEPDAR